MFSISSFNSKIQEIWGKNVWWQELSLEAELIQRTTKIHNSDSYKMKDFNKIDVTNFYSFKGFDSCNSLYGVQ